MAGKLQVNRKAPCRVRKVGFMNKQNSGFAIGNLAQRFSKVRLPVEYVVHAGDPETGAMAIHVKGVIAQDGYPMALQRPGYELGVTLIVVSQHSEDSHGSMQFAEDLGARYSGQVIRKSNVIPGQEDYVRVQFINQANSFSNYFCIAFRRIVKIA